MNTESRNPNTTNLDKMTTYEMMAAFQRENENAAKAVGEVLPAIARVVEAIFKRYQKGGRIIYVGCGTSGRLGVLDASECPPTFGVSEGKVVGLIAGGYERLVSAAENEEDNADAAVKDLSTLNLTENDSVIGISAAGFANYVVSAVKYAKEQGCFTACITNNANTALSKAVDEPIEALTGAEVLTGSTRLKAGTAQKLILNMISTSVMVKMGYVYENLMVNLRPTNVKLRKRVISIVRNVLSCDHERATDLLDRANWEIKAAIKLGKEEK